MGQLEEVTKIFIESQVEMEGQVDNYVRDLKVMCEKYCLEKNGREFCDRFFVTKLISHSSAILGLGLSQISREHRTDAMKDFVVCVKNLLKAYDEEK